MNPHHQNIKRTFNYDVGQHIKMHPLQFLTNILCVTDCKCI